MFIKLTIFFLISTLVLSSDLDDLEEKVQLTECDLAQKTNEPICSLNRTITTTFISSSKYRLPIEIQNGNIIWLNKYQPANTRWSQLCPSPFLIKSTKINNNKCLNAQTCDQDSFCLIAYELNSQIKFNDNIMLQNDDGPQFTEDLKSFNVTFDLENEQDELLLIDSTNKLDLLRSKTYRSINEFKLEAGNAASVCQSSKDMFMLRFDQVEEKLYLKLVNKTINLKVVQCFDVNLTVKRQSAQLSSLSSVKINIIDNRLDKPVFDHLVYNFTISENSPIDTLIGNIHAQYKSLQKVKQNQIKYRIVPFITNGIDSSLNQFIKTNQEELMVPVGINQISGSLSLKLNLDREKYFDNKEQQSLNSDGILSLSIESSYASIKYAYCKVNIFIEDVNDNQPMAKLIPMSNYGIKPKQINDSIQATDTNSAIMNLYINEKTPVNQILAYLAVYDPDSGENGTIKSIDLTLISYKQASNQTVKERSLKLKQLNQQESVNYLMPQVPFRLNKIGDKVFTVQLVSELDYKQIESYTIEMRIKDNGTHPQLESKTIINVNVIDQNEYPPMFTHDSLINVIIEEQNQASQNVFKVNAIDLDDGKNGEIRYKIVNNPFLDLVISEFEAKKRLDTTFELNAQTGELILLRPLVRDNDIDGQYLDLVIMAFDNYGLLEQNYDYESESEDLQSSGYKSLNSTCVIRIKIADKNNNKPIFETDRLNLTLKRLVRKTGFKYLGSAVIIDLDSYETNSKNFKNDTFHKFIFTDNSCKQSFNFHMVSIDTPFVFLVELIEAKNQVKCKLSVWLDLNYVNDLRHLNKVDFIINVKDNGDQQSDELSTLSIRINLNKDEIEQETTIYEIDRRINNKIESLDNKNLNKINSVFKLNQLYRFQLEEFQIVNNSIILNNDDGIYFLDFMQNQERHQIKVILFSNELARDFNRKLLKDYEQKMNLVLNRQEFVDKPLTQFKGLLLNNSILVTGTNLTALFFNNQNKTSFSQFVVLICVILLFIIVIFSCCVCFLIRIKKQNRSKFDSAMNRQNLNVTDDDTGGFKQHHSVVVIEDLKNYLTDESSTKVNRYLDGLDTTVLQLHSEKYMALQTNQQSSPSSTDSIKSSNELNANNKCILSTTSSSCMSSDESGCYGSSDFSSEVNLRLKQQQLIKNSNFSATYSSSLIFPVKLPLANN